MVHKRIRRLVALVFALAAMAPALSTQPELGAAQEPALSTSASPLPNSSFFGMNLYLTGLERPKEESVALLADAQSIGVKWSREEMSWANLEPGQKGGFNWFPYDGWIKTLY